MPRRILALALVVMLPVVAACSNDSDGNSNGRPSQAEISTSLQKNASFTKEQADCVAKDLMTLSTANLKAIANNDKQGSVPKAERDAAEKAITKALTDCAVLTPSTTIP